MRKDKDFTYIGPFFYTLYSLMLNSSGDNAGLGELFLEGRVDTVYSIHLT